MENNYNKGAYERAKKRVKEIKSFYIHLLCYCIVIPLLIFINLKFTPGYYWFIYSVIGWGCGLIIHGLGAFGYLPYMNRDWEERKIKEYMDKEKK